ncbi:choline-sulfatase [Deinococcus yavapaiensis]|uniref:choline-sulfatase n=1 Tax=Deinococcus yavapaiensis TaxID=309889 RepID=UPI0014756F32|nr:choline-sulfatase [Deinococcus yavapaiensis]
MSVNKPNILVIMVDQMAHDVIGALGHPTVLTPNLDALVRRGVAFDHAYCNSPICVSSRVSFMTGRLVRHTNAFDNGSEFPASLPTFAHRLNLAGYTTILSGKMHFVGPDQLHGFRERLTPDISPTGFELTPDWTRGPYPNPGTSVQRLRYPPVRPWSLQLAYDEEVLHHTLARLRRLALEDAPFFLCASFSHPHDPFLTPEPYWAAYEDRPVAPPNVEAHDEDLHPFNRWIQIHHEADRFPLTPEETLRARRAYYAAVSYVDSIVGRLLAELDRVGLGDTLVVFTSDHGEMLGEHGMWFKRTFYDGAAKVPLIVSRPSTFAPARRSEVVSLVDLTATLLDLAEVEAPSDADGGSLKPLLSGSGGPWKDFAVSEYFSEGTVEPMLMLRAGRFKFVYVHEQAPLLFDLQADPYEQRDLASDSAYAIVREELQAALLAGLDVSELRERIVRGQHERLLIAAATRDASAWKYRPSPDAVLYERPKS